MRPTWNLLQAPLRLTLFTRANCSLCETAKVAVSQIQNSGRKYGYEEVDILEKGNEDWRNAYEFDVPVLHIRRENQHETVPASQKLMHRFSSEQIKQIMDSLSTTPAQP